MPAPRGRTRVFFVASATVCVVALIAALLASGGFDLAFVDDGEGLAGSDRDRGATATTSRSSRATTTTRTTSPRSTTPTPPANEVPDPDAAPPQPPAAIGPDEQRAVDFLREKIEMCVADQGLDPAIDANFEYTATPGEGPEVFTVVITAPPPGGSATFSLDLAAGSIAGVDGLGSDFVAACPNFGATGA